MCFQCHFHGKCQINVICRMLMCICWQDDKQGTAGSKGEGEKSKKELKKEAKKNEKAAKASFT